MTARDDVNEIWDAIESQRIQEVHILVIHLLCELIEGQLLATQPEKSDWQLDRAEVPIASSDLNQVISR